MLWAVQGCNYEKILTGLGNGLTSTKVPTDKDKNKLQASLSLYTLQDHTLEEVDSAKYLGVTIQSNLSWNKHIDNITAKANKTKAFLQRNIWQYPKKMKEARYRVFVGPLVEYASKM